MKDHQKAREAKERNWKIYQLRGFYSLSRQFIMDPKVVDIVKDYVDQELGKLGATSIDEHRRQLYAKYDLGE